ncbi:uncharacterized protein LOC143062164 [Mytilus galloprovincialis]|uniref:uncharacterized protein LOC143062164 n=1 Tax=Mytilus galloprovincialis TaxID=29158 RepID=UPI003F7C4364
MEILMKLCILWFIGIVLTINISESTKTCHSPATISLCKSSSDDVDNSHTHCYVKKVYTAHGWFIERGGTNESVCITNAGMSTINNPDCRATTTPPWTTCYDCCQQINCDTASVYCNAQNVINPKYMPLYMKTGNRYFF